ncbi:hypothetical protein [Nafulsella turpanensis]|uniref:hypothetical protein n=1 Tax=Nafulsella turpanensis TaxID=1265690 RepID=UPI0003471DB8|nr:hypothetical protein [Nafulsella turpanensis]
MKNVYFYMMIKIRNMFIRTKLVHWLTFNFAAAITLYPFVLVAPRYPLKKAW